MWSGCKHVESALKCRFRCSHWERSDDHSTGTWEVPAAYLWYLRVWSLHEKFLLYTIMYLAVWWLLWWSYTCGTNMPLYRVGLFTNISKAPQKSGSLSPLGSKILQNTLPSCIAHSHRRGCLKHSSSKGTILMTIGPLLKSEAEEEWVEISLNTQAALLT